MKPSYFFSVALLVICFMCTPCMLQAQEEGDSTTVTRQEETLAVTDSTQKQPPVEEKTPWEPPRLTSFRFGFDPIKPVEYLLSDIYLSIADIYELRAEFTINNRVFIAGGYGVQNTLRQDLTVNQPDPLRPGQTDNKRYEYSNSGTYLRYGIHYNLIGSKTRYDAVYFGLQWNQATFDHDLITGYPDRYWNIPDEAPSTLLQYNQTGLKADWFDLVVGFKVRLFGDFYMGAEGRLSNLGSVTESPDFSIVQVPGYGLLKEGETARFTFGYQLLYSIPIMKRKAIFLEPKQK